MKHLLPLIISGFVLCGFFAVCLCVFLVPRSEPELESESVSEFDLFPPFQPVYFDTSIPSNFQFVVSVPLNANAYDFVWSYSPSGRSFIPASLPISVFTPHGNYITLNYDRFSDLSSYCAFYIRCKVYETGTSNLLHTYYFSYQFFDFPVSSSVSSSARSVLLDPESEPETEDEPEPETEDEPEPETEDEPEPETEDEPELEPVTEDESEPELER